MTLIAQSTLIALQSYAAPAKSSATASSNAFTALVDGAVTDPQGDRRPGGQGDGVSVQLSPQAAKHLDAAGFAVSGDTNTEGATRAPLASSDNQKPETAAPAPPGSRLDITI